MSAAALLEPILRSARTDAAACYDSWHRACYCLPAKRQCSRRSSNMTDTGWAFEAAWLTAATYVTCVKQPVFNDEKYI